MRIAFVGVVLAGGLMASRVEAHGQQGAREVTATGGIFHSDVRSTTGLYYSLGVLVQRPDGTWASADYPVVTRVDSGSVAQRAGLMPNDVILAVNGRDARLGQVSIGTRPGERQRVFRVRRGADEQDIVVQQPDATSGNPPTP